MMPIAPQAGGEVIGYESYYNKEEAKHREKILKRNKRMQYFFKKRLMAAKEVVG
ncbi:MAG: hypothetical protein L6420_01005 [Elusimicrobia bacterium]|nr:hypothetical protein [Elusimicrobiota bacterium]